MCLKGLLEQKKKKTGQKGELEQLYIHLPIYHVPVTGLLAEMVLNQL